MHKLSLRFRLFLCFFVSLCIPVCAQSVITITTTSVPNGTQGVAYSQQLYATGGTAPYRWTYGVGGPPSGMSLSSGGLLYGTPGGNTYPFSTTINVIVQDSQGNQAAEDLPITINPAGNQALAITTTSVPNGTEGVAYSQQLYVTGGTSPYTWSTGAQGPPSGMSLSSSGLLSGTPSGNTYPDQAEINVIVTDSASHTATEILPLLINPANSQSLTITTTSVPNGTEGVAYSQQLSATGGTAPYTWSIGTQGPPSGMSLSSSGLLSGTPSGNTYPYQAEINVIVTDSASNTANEVLPLLVNPAGNQSPLAITTTSVPNGTQGAAYSQQLYATGGAAPYTWSIGTQGPPSGMSLSSSGLLSGTPSGNTYPYQAEINVIVTDSASNQVTEVLPLLINPANNQSLAITTTSVPDGTQGVAYSQQLYVTGGTAPYTWSTGTQGPPSGMSLSSSGLLSGTPSGNTYPYQAEINVIVTDSASHQATEVLPLLIDATNGQPLAITTTSVPDGIQGTAYSQQLSATGGTAPYTWSIGAQGPPSGMSLSSSGLLSGTPSGNAYPYQAEINVIVTDSASHQATEVLPLLIDAVGQSLAITTPSLPNGTQGVAYSQQLSATGGTAPYTWSTGSGGPPSGMALSSSGLLSGTPSGNTYPFSTTINVIVTDSASHQATVNFSITIDAASGQSLVITTTSVPNGTQGVAYSQQLSASGGTAPYTWSTGTGQPPSGMSLSSSGLLSGTPSGNTYPFNTTINVIVTDSASNQATEPLPITIGAAETAIPASFIGVANYSTNQNVYVGDLAQFNTTWWLGGSQLGDEPNELQMLENGYHFVPTFNTGNVGVEQNFFTASGSGACVTTSTGCTANTSHMQETIQLAYNEIGPGGYYSIGNEEDNTSSDDVAPDVYVPQFQAWVNVIKGIDPTAHIVGPNMEQWSCCTSTSTNPWGTAGAWFQAFITAYEQAYGGKPPIDVLSMHLYNTNPATGASSDDFTSTEDTSMVNDVQNYRNYANGVGYTGTPIWITEFGFDHKLQVGPQTPEQNAQAAQVVEELAGAASSLGLQRIFWFTANAQLIIDDGLDPLYDPAATSSPNAPMPLTDLGQLASNLAHNQIPLITTTSLPIGNTGVGYSQQLVATGGTAPYTWTAQGLPSGISLSSSGLLTGTPSGNSTDIEATVTDSTGNTATEVLPFKINVLTITTTSVPNATQGVAYSQQLVATGGTAPYTWTYLLNPPNDLPGGVGPLPNGMSLSSSGLLSGTPSGNTLYPDAAEFWIAVVVTDNQGNTANEILPLLLDASGIPQFAITTASLPAGTVGQPYSQQLTATGGYIEISDAYTWSYGGQALPAGLTLSSSGLLSGTPVNPGQTSINVVAIDDVTNQASKAFTLTIGPANSQSLAITTTSVPSATQGMAYSQTLNATGGTGSYTWTAQSTPGGISLSSDGVLFGTPSGDAYPETANINVTVTDSASNQASEVLALTINAMGSEQTAIPASFIAVANYGAFSSSNPQNVYSGDLDQFNTKWWLGGSQVETADQNQLNMLQAGYHFLPIVNTGEVAVEENMFVPNPEDPNSCKSTACASYNDGPLGTQTQSQPCGPEVSGNQMRYTACLAASEVGPGGYYGIGNEENAGGSDDVSPSVYVGQFTEWVNLIKQYDSTAHIVGPSMTSWSCCGGGVSYNYPWGPGGQWFTAFVAAYQAANSGALPPIDVLSMHLYNNDTTSVQNAVSTTQADNFVNEVTYLRNAANAAGYTTAGTPIWITEMGFDYDIPGQTLVSPQYGQTGPHTADQNAQITRVINGLAAAGPSLNLQRIFLFTLGDSYDIDIGLEPLYNPTSTASPSTPMLLTDYGTLVHDLAYQQ